MYKKQCMRVKWEAAHCIVVSDEWSTKYIVFTVTNIIFVSFDSCHWEYRSKTIEKILKIFPKWRWIFQYFNMKVWKYENIKLNISPFIYITKFLVIEEMWLIINQAQVKWIEEPGIMMPELPGRQSNAETCWPSKFLISESLKTKLIHRRCAAGARSLAVQ